MKSEFDYEESRLRQRSWVEVVNERRKEINMSLRELESLSGIRHSTISDIFRKHDIRLWQLFELSRALDISMLQLMHMADRRYRDILLQETSNDEYAR